MHALFTAAVGLESLQYASCATLASQLDNAKNGSLSYRVPRLLYSKLYIIITFYYWYGTLITIFIVHRGK